jgi:hypothetical protein
MNRLLIVFIALLVLGIAVSRANDILIALSPYRSVEVAPSGPPVSADEPELAGRIPT